MERLRPGLKTQVLKQQHFPETAGAGTQSWTPRPTPLLLPSLPSLSQLAETPAPGALEVVFPPENVSASSPRFSLTLRSDSGTTHTRCQLLEADVSASCDPADSLRASGFSSAGCPRRGLESRGTGRLPRKHTHTHAEASESRRLPQKHHTHRHTHTHTYIHTNGPLNPGTRRLPWKHHTHMHI